MLRSIGVGLAGLLLGACAADCPPQATECHGAVLWMCSPRGLWEWRTNCEAISGRGPWRCCHDRDIGDACLPVEECVDD